jgi:hypothetical protein
MTPTHGCYQPRSQADATTPAPHRVQPGGVSADQPTRGPDPESRHQADATSFQRLHTPDLIALHDGVRAELVRRGYGWYR